MFKRFVLSSVSALIVALGGCATGELGEPTLACKVNTDCPERYLCSPITKTCVLPMTMLDMDRPDEGAGQDMRMDMTSKPADMADQGMDMVTPPACDPACGLGQSCVDGQCRDDVVTCSPACKANEECKQGTCVPVETGQCTPACPQTEVCDNGTCRAVVCDPACEANGQCTRDGCVYPACAKEGDACDGTTSDQGSFWCLRSSMTNRSSCYAKCPTANEPGGCTYGQYCQAPVSNNSQIKICLDADCQVDADCDNGAQKGTCIKVDHGYAFCVLAGSVPPGGTCDSSNAALRCQQGSYCTASGVCRAICDPWTRPSQCGANERCNILTERQGICVNNPDQSGMSTYDPCTTPGNYCADGTVCLNGTSNNFCFKHCRVDRNGNSADCAGLAITGSVCYNYFFAGQRELGICQPSCASASECGSTTTRDCVAGQCRRKCSAATVTQDCCGGDVPCDWSCVNGLCE